MRFALVHERVSAFVIWVIPSFVFTKDISAISHTCHRSPRRQRLYL